jgi:hypothetical protein
MGLKTTAGAAATRAPRPHGGYMSPAQGLIAHEALEVLRLFLEGPVRQLQPTLSGKLLTNTDYLICSEPILIKYLSYIRVFRD